MNLSRTETHSGLAHGADSPPAGRTRPPSHKLEAVLLVGAELVQEREKFSGLYEEGLWL